MITDKLASYGAAMREVMPSVEHRPHKGLNNRAENSHQPTRERERRMRRFKDPGTRRTCLSDPFAPRPHLCVLEITSVRRDGRMGAGMWTEAHRARHEAT